MTVVFTAFGCEVAGSSGNITRQVGAVCKVIRQGLGRYLFTLVPPVPMASYWFNPYTRGSAGGANIQTQVNGATITLTTFLAAIPADVDWAMTGFNSQ